MSLLIILVISTLYSASSIYSLEKKVDELYQKQETQIQYGYENQNIEPSSDSVIASQAFYEFQVPLGRFESDYDSGWIPIEPGETYNLSHGQGYQVIVYLLGWDYVDGGGQVIHQTSSGDCFWGEEGACNGLQWCCSCRDHITIHRNIDDEIWDEFRLFIWKLET